MKKTIILILLSFFIVSSAWAGGAQTHGGGGMRIPRVNYISPKDESEVTPVEDAVTFRWKPTPIPVGGRKAYRFRIYKDFGYDVVYKEDLKPDITAIEMPAKIFEKDQTYTWEVKQKGMTDTGWSADNRWSFKVKK